MALPGLPVIGLAWDDLDLQRPDLDLMITIAEGLDNLPVHRGSDQVLPFRTGRLPQPVTADHRPVVANGWIAGFGALPRQVYRAYLDELKRHLDPTKGPRFLVATLEDGARRWIRARAQSLLPGDEIGGEFALMSIQWDACDPYWYGSWGTLALDGGFTLDDGYFVDGSGELVIVPTSGNHQVVVDTQGTADVERMTCRLLGPSVTGPGVEVAMPDGSLVGFALTEPINPGEELVLDNAARTVTVGPTSKRGSMSLRSGNRHGEYIRLRPGLNTVRIVGQPAEARLQFTPTYL